jgi:predicted dehydrogenase
VQKIRVGVIGVGYFGQFHAEKYAKIDGVELVGVVDTNPSRAKEVAKRFRTQAFFHHTELFDKVQAVSIAIPTPLHHPVTKEFFLQGIDVLLEKPIASTLQEADELIGLAESKDLIFQVGHLERFNGALAPLEKIVQNPLFIESHRMGPFSGRATDVDVVIDLMVHDIDILLHWIDSKVKQSQATGLSILTPHLDVANARIEFENGCIANLTASRISREKIRKTRIFQPDGTISIDYLLQKISVSKKESRPGREGIPEMVTHDILARKVDLLESEILSFLKSVKDRKNVCVSGGEGRRALEVALQILQKIDETTGKKG